MDAGYRIWVGGLNRDVTVDDLAATFVRFGDLSEGVRLRFRVNGAEAVITYDDKQTAARALSANGTYIVEDCVHVTWYEQRPDGSLFKEDY
ncbi:hypothetical protein Q7P35_005912 [Cladosporium inversicolor]